MPDARVVMQALEELRKNPEQYEAAHEKSHCVVLAGPGSGKTKTLTTAMARALLEDVKPPRGVACITYNNECAIELEDRLAKLGVNASDEVFIGTVHSFALMHVIRPYARCVAADVPANFRVATQAEEKEVVKEAYAQAIGGYGSPSERWKYAQEKRRTDVDRRQQSWKEHNPQLADFIEAYENELRRRGLIDLEDMPLIALRMIQENPWIREALRARFPILFVDEYQDLGYALHQLVLSLCFGTGVRLFAVGDPDQSIYGFNQANPELLKSLSQRPDVKPIQLRINYRFGERLIRASVAALGEERRYEAPENTPQGEVLFRGVDGGIDAQASFVAGTIVPQLEERGVRTEEIAILYRKAEHGDAVAAALEKRGVPFVRSDRNALVKRSSRWSRLLEACARWVTGGWQNASPPFHRLVSEAMVLVYGYSSALSQRQEIERELIAFLQQSIDSTTSTNAWLTRAKIELVDVWRPRARVLSEEWDHVSEMIERTEPSQGKDIPLTYFAGKIEGTGRVALSTLHSAKGREFDAVVLFGMNSDFPHWRDLRSGKVSDARRLFYVGVTRARQLLYLVAQKDAPSPWLRELYNGLSAS